MDIEITPRQALTLLLSVIGLLFIMHIMSIVMMFGLERHSMRGLVELLNLGKEGNIPTLFSSLQLLVASLLLAIIGACHKSNGAKFLSWFVLAVIFLFLAIDETARLHERLIEPVRTAFDLSGALAFSWVVPYGISVLIFVIAFSRFLLALPRETAWRFVVSGAIFVAGAIGFEMLGAMQAESYGTHNLVYATIQTFEELLELLGIALFIYALLAYVVTQFQYLRGSVRGEHQKNA